MISKEKRNEIIKVLKDQIESVRFYKVNYFMCNEEEAKDRKLIKLKVELAKLQGEIGITYAFLNENEDLEFKEIIKETNTISVQVVKLSITRRQAK